MQERGMEMCASIDKIKSEKVNRDRREAAR